MKVTLNKNNLEIILSNFQSFLEKRDASQITSHIYMETTDNKLLLKATDYEISIQAKIDIIQKYEDGKATANGREFLDMIKNLDGEITLRKEKDLLFIEGNKPKKFTGETPTYNAEEFNNATRFPEISDSDTKINLESVSFIESIKKVSVATDTGTNKDSAKIELTGTLIDVKDFYCNFVATDTRRLAIIRQNTQSVGSQLSIIIPKRAVTEITKLFYDEFEIYFSNVMLFIKSHNYTFSTKLINAKYPDYEKIIPKEFKTELKLPKNDIVESIRLINSLSPNIKVTFEANGLTFEAISVEESKSARTQFEIPLNIQESIILGMNSRYVLDFLTHIDSSDFSIFINDTNTPFMLKDDNYTTIVMPVLC